MRYLQIFQVRRAFYGSSSYDLDFVVAEISGNTNTKDGVLVSTGFSRPVRLVDGDVQSCTSQQGSFYRLFAQMTALSTLLPFQEHLFWFRCGKNPS